jgi:hypothetical protein
MCLQLKTTSSTCYLEPKMSPPPRARTTGAPEFNQHPSEGHSDFSFLSFQAQLSDALDGLIDKIKKEQIQVALKKLDCKDEKGRSMIRQAHENFLIAHNECYSSLRNILERRNGSSPADSPLSS